MVQYIVIRDDTCTYIRIQYCAHTHTHTPLFGAKASISQAPLVVQGSVHAFHLARSSCPRSGEQ